jgi:hypothetical protein
VIVDLVRTPWAWHWLIDNLPKDLLKNGSENNEENRCIVAAWLKEQNIYATWADQHNTFFADFPDEMATWLILKH